MLILETPLLFFLNFKHKGEENNNNKKKVKIVMWLAGRVPKTPIEWANLTAKLAGGEVGLRGFDGSRVHLLRRAAAGYCAYLRILN